LAKIKKRILGRTGVEVTELGFGGIPIIPLPQDKAVRILHRALDRGINYLDTARAYGTSETKIGEVMKTRREECFLATKTHFYGAQEARQALKTSMKELQTNVIDLYQIHDLSSRERYEKAMGKGGALEELFRARDRGRVRFLGVTGHNIELLMEALDSGHFDAILCVYNLAIPDAKDVLLPKAQSMNVGVAVMKPLSGGALFALSKNRITPHEALRFVLSNPNITTALGGAKLIRDIEQNVRIAKTYLPMTEQEATPLVEMAKKLGEAVCRNCRYCENCPEHIPVPTIMQLFDHSKAFGYEWPKHRKIYAALPVKADVCTQCGACEKSCPFKLPVRQRLAQAHKRFNQPV